MTEQRANGAIVVEAGGSLGVKRRSTGADVEQRRIKAELIAKAWALGGLDAVALGEADWGLGATFVRELVTESGLPLVAANLTCDGATFPGGVVVRRDAGTVGVVGIAVGTVEGCTVGEPAAALRRAIAALGAVDVVLGLLPIDDDRSLRALLEENVGIDVAIDARGRAIAAPAERIGETWTVGAGTRARSIGVLTLALRGGASGWAPRGYAEQMREKRTTLSQRVVQLDERLAGAIELEPTTKRRLEQQRDGYAKQVVAIDVEVAALSGAKRHEIHTEAIDLSDRIADHPATETLVVAAKQEITATAGVDPSRFVPRVVAEGPYAGGETCVPCHESEHAQWSGTGHARAWSTLVTEDRAFDSDCWTCHVTGANQEGGPPAATSSGGWRDVQCEACHGPSRAHAASPATVDSLRAPPPGTCTVCHDGEQDGGRFDPDSYHPKIEH